MLRKKINDLPAKLTVQRNALACSCAIMPMKTRSRATDPNLQFYQNALRSKPRGDLIDNIHSKWDGQFDRLEIHHGYIQWLFPVFENAGVNAEASPLSKPGAAMIRADATCQRRVIKSYRLMLKFYGLALADECTGALTRHPDAELYASQMGNLNLSSHNWLRISRLIISLGELGFRRYKLPLVETLRKEVDCGALANAKGSLEKFWLPLVEGEGTAWYTAKTLEHPSDRAEGALFQQYGELAMAGRETNREDGKGWQWRSNEEMSCRRNELVQLQMGRYTDARRQAAQQQQKLQAARECFDAPEFQAVKERFASAAKQQQRKLEGRLSPEQSAWALSDAGEAVEVLRTARHGACMCACSCARAYMCGSAPFFVAALVCSCACLRSRVHPCMQVGVK